MLTKRTIKYYKRLANISSTYWKRDYDWEMMQGCIDFFINDESYENISRPPRNILSGRRKHEPTKRHRINKAHRLLLHKPPLYIKYIEQMPWQDYMNGKPTFLMMEQPVYRTLNGQPSHQIDMSKYVKGAILTSRPK